MSWEMPHAGWLHVRIHFKGRRGSRPNRTCDAQAGHLLNEWASLTWLWLQPTILKQHSIAWVDYSRVDHLITFWVATQPAILRHWYKHIVALLHFLFTSFLVELCFYIDPQKLNRLWQGEFCSLHLWRWVTPPWLPEVRKEQMSCSCRKETGPQNQRWTVLI